MRGDLLPFLTLGQDVVVRKRYKVIAMRFIPIHDHLGKIIAVAPVRVGMEIAFIPFISILGAGLAGEKADQD